MEFSILEKEKSLRIEQQLLDVQLGQGYQPNLNYTSLQRLIRQRLLLFILEPDKNLQEVGTWLVKPLKQQY